MRRERLSLAPSADREDLARRLLDAHARQVAWCVVDWASEATAALTDLLLTNWGPGLCYQPGVPWADPTRPAVLPRNAVSRILRAAKIRIWSSESDVPDRDRVMESLEHGCLPLQYVGTTRIDGYEGRGAALRALLLGADASGALDPLTDEEFGSRIKLVTEALTTGELEQNLSMRHG